MWRHILGAILGIIVSGVLVFAVETIGHRIYPPPEGIEKASFDEMRKMIADAPSTVFIPVMLAWMVGALGGTALAVFISRKGRYVHAAIIGGLLLLAGVANMVMIPHPLWFTILAPLGIVLAAWLGSRVPTPK